jgi:small subunit ribosomal protein S16
LLRGVTLGLFDEATAMEKFTKWSTEHDSEFAKRQESHKKSKTTSRQPYVKRAEKSSAPKTETASAKESSGKEE